MLIDILIKKTIKISEIKIIKFFFQVIETIICWYYYKISKKNKKISSKFFEIFQIFSDGRLYTFYRRKKHGILVKLLDKNLEIDDKVWELKQQMTLKIIDGFSVDDRIRGILRSFKSEGYIIACATNSIRETAKLQLIRKGFFEYIDFMYSNQDVKNPKPNSEMYLKCMIKAEVNPNETLIIEDSDVFKKF